MIKLIQTRPKKFTGDLLALLVRQPENGAPACGEAEVQPLIELAFAAGDFAGKEEQTLLFYPQPSARLAAKRVLVVGLGDKQLCREIFRKAGGATCGAALKTKASRLAVLVPESLDFDQEEMIECLTEGLVLGSYRFRKYKTAADKNNNDQGRIEEIILYCGRAGASKRGFAAGRRAALAACAARDMANEPGNRWTPTHFADFGRDLAGRMGLTCRVLERAEMKRLGMGGMLGVSSGSAQPPRMVIVEYQAGKNLPTLLLVGKGLTFDAGGINLKPSAKLEEMKYDMCGGAAVLALMQAVGEERPKGLNIVAIIPAAENLLGPAALKPGDVITMYGGKTVEVINTDAEGRLILADALAYGIDRYKPAAVIDLATLTGAVVISLGHHRTGLLASDDDLAERIRMAGERSGEPVWRLPLGPEYAKLLKSEVADLKNIGDRTGGSITAAAFLQEFVGEKVPWAHLDIAGTAYNFTEKSYVAKGPSGTGVRTLLDLIRQWK